MFTGELEARCAMYSIPPVSLLVKLYTTEKAAPIIKAITALNIGTVTHAIGGGV
jgi:hypothetical protein